MPWSAPVAYCCDRVVLLLLLQLSGCEGLALTTAKGCAFDCVPRSSPAADCSDRVVLPLLPRLFNLVREEMVLSTAKSRAGNRVVRRCFRGGLRRCSVGTFRGEGGDSNMAFLRRVLPNSTPGTARRWASDDCTRVVRRRLLRGLDLTSGDVPRASGDDILQRLWRVADSAAEEASDLSREVGCCVGVASGRLWRDRVEGEMYGSLAEETASCDCSKMGGSGGKAERGCSSLSSIISELTGGVGGR